MIFQRIEIIQPQNTGPSNNPDRHTHSGSSDTAERSAEARHGPTQESDDVDFQSQEEVSSDDEISEYKRVRLLNDGRMRWDPLTCVQELSISKTGLGVAFPGPRPFVDPTAFAFVGATPRPKNSMADLDGLKMYFEIKIRAGEVWVGFNRADRTPWVSTTPGIDGVYAYCSNDGTVFVNSPYPRTTGISAWPGAVVGCGLYRRTGYFTLNRRLISKLQR